jgi:hypothetical protein
MNCFSHTNNDAIGCCSNCNRAVCKECIIETENRIYCSLKCRKEKERVDEYVKWNISQGDLIREAQDKGMFCNFCGRSSEEVVHLIQGNNSSICEDCVKLSLEHFSWAKIRNKPLWYRKILEILGYNKKPPQDVWDISRKKID